MAPTGHDAGDEGGDDADFDYDLPMLTEAVAKARKLVAEIERTRDEANASPPKDLSPEQLAQGRQALDNAVASARRTLEALEAAYAIALRETRGRDGDDPDPTYVNN